MTVKKRSVQMIKIRGKKNFKKVNFKKRNSIERVECKGSLAMSDFRS